MKLKVLIIIGILTIIALPSIPAQIQDSELNTINETNKTNTGVPFEVVFFCFGRITNLEEFAHGYCFYYTFNAINVICITFTDDHPFIPVIRRFNNSECLGMAYLCGIITEHFIFAFGG